MIVLGRVKSGAIASFCFCGANKFDDGLLINQGHASPIGFDVTKQTMLNQIPLGCAGWQVRHDWY